MMDSRQSVGYGSRIENSAVRCKNSGISFSISISITSLPLRLNSSLSLLSRFGRDNMVSISVWVVVSRIGIWISISIVSIGVWMDKAVVDNRGFNLNSLNFWCLVNNRSMISIGKIPGVSFRISFRFSFTFLTLCFNSWSFFLGSSSGGSYSEWKPMPIGVWMDKAVVDNRGGFNLNSLNFWCLINNRGLISIGKIPGVGFRISFTLLTLCFNSWSFFLGSSSRCSYSEWKSMSIDKRIPSISSIGIGVSIVSIGVWMDKAVIDKGGGFNHSLNFWCLINNRGMISIGKIPGVSFRISFRF